MPRSKYGISLIPINVPISMSFLKELCGYNKSFLIASGEYKWKRVKDNE